MYFDMEYDVTLRLHAIGDVVVHRVAADDEREAAILAISDPKFADTDASVVSVRYVEDKKQ